MLLQRARCNRGHLTKGPPPIAMLAASEAAAAAAQLAGDDVSDMAAAAVAALPADPPARKRRKTKKDSAVQGEGGTDDSAEGGTAASLRDRGPLELHNIWKMTSEKKKDLEQQGEHRAPGHTVQAWCVAVAAVVQMEAAGNSHVCVIALV